MLALPERLRFARNPRGILTVPTGHTRCVRTHTRRRDHSFKRQVTERIGLDELPDLLDTHLRRDQFRLVRRVDAVVTRTNRRRTTDAHVNLFRTRFSDHAYDFFRRRAADDRVVDQNHAPAVDQIAHRVELDAHAERADRLPRLDERAANVMIAHESETKTQAALGRVTN